MILARQKIILYRVFRFFMKYFYHIKLTNIYLILYFNSQNMYNKIFQIYLQNNFRFYPNFYKSKVSNLIKDSNNQNLPKALGVFYYLTK